MVSGALIIDVCNGAIFSYLVYALLFAMDLFYHPTIFPHYCHAMGVVLPSGLFVTNRSMILLIIFLHTAEE